ncbi:DtxR family Mn-dependent transcriptional regulator [Paeniglutamicibacter cryotolerans]|uniref:Manganese transport regulator n=1 Tax=Paeniglutamicibacter cryotolerans TaxID=670079 RepID=A0A839QNN9_9MICC|nr:DtxR family Mn-dependent transcriptional regulator [Paeniglutamicibacter cryotolerans]
MDVSSLSISTQNYLKAIWSWQEWSDEPVTTSVVAEKVGLRASTVSEAIRKLNEQGLVDHERYGHMTLTEAGRLLAVQMVRRHRLLESFLVQALKYRWDEVHEEAEHLEHVVSEMLVTRIDEYLGFPRRDPHGDPIPRADGTTHRPDAVPLSDIEPQGLVRVERISDADAKMLQFFAERGIVLDAELSVAAGEPYSDAVLVAVSGRDAEPLRLGPAAAGAIWVSSDQG